MAFDDAPISSLFWHGDNFYHPVSLPDTTGLSWREGILCLESVLPWARTSPPSSAALPSPQLSAAPKSSPPPLTGKSTPPSVALPSLQSSAALSSPPAAVHSSKENTPGPVPRKCFSVPALPECPPVPVPRKRPPEPAPWQRPQVPTPPEHPLVPAPPVPTHLVWLPDRAPTFPNKFFGGGSRAPAVEAGMGAGAVASETVPPWHLEFTDPPWPPESLDPPWRPESLELPWLPAPP